MVLNHFFPILTFDTPENIKKQRFYNDFRGNEKKTLKIMS